MHFIRLNPKRDWASRLASLRRNAFRLLPPVLFATLSTAIWYCCHQRGWYVHEKTEVMLGTAVLVDAAIFAIAAALILNGVWERSRNIARFVLTQDKDKFMEIRDEKIPIAMHLMLAALGMSVLILLAAAHYPTVAGGGVIVFSTAFTMSLYFVITLELQEPTTSIWFAARIPADWLSEDVDKYFKEKAEGQDG